MNVGWVFILAAWRGNYGIDWYYAASWDSRHNWWSGQQAQARYRIQQCRNCAIIISKFTDAGLIEEYNSDFLSRKEGKRA
jgi:hypothetical protein